MNINRSRGHLSARGLWLLQRLVVACLAVLAGPGGSVAEEDTWYTVELIVFERTGDAALGAESWREDPGLPTLAGALELLPGQAADPGNTVAGETGLPRAFRRLPEDALGLNTAWQRLERSEEFRPLLHVAWNQPGFAQEAARMVHVHNDNSTFGVSKGASAQEVAATGGYLGSAFSARDTMARNPARPALDGTVRLHRARYLHLQFDLLYYRPSATRTTAPRQTALPNSSDAALVEQLLAEELRQPTLFRLTESRRMRSGEVHYIDHPLFGVLVQVRPLARPPEENVPVSTPAAPPGAGGAPASPPAAKPTPGPVPPGTSG